MTMPHSLTPVIRLFEQPDGARWFIGHIEEWPGVVVEEEAWSAVMAALQAEVRVLAPQLGIGNAFLQTDPVWWERRVAGSVGSPPSRQFSTFRSRHLRFDAEIPTGMHELAIP